MASPSWSTTSAAGRRSASTHLSINTMGAGLATVDEHLEVLAHAAEAVLPTAG